MRQLATNGLSNILAHRSTWIAIVNMSYSAMATPASQGRNTDDLSFIELGQLLSRLKQSVLHPTSERDRRLRTSEYERTRVESVWSDMRTAEKNNRIIWYGYLTNGRL